MLKKLAEICEVPRSSGVPIQYLRSIGISCMEQILRQLRLRLQPIKVSNSIAAEVRLVWPERRSGGAAASPERSARRAAPCRLPTPTSLARAAEPARAERRAQGWLRWRRPVSDVLLLFTLQVKLHDDCHE